MRTYDDYVESRQEMPDIAKAEDALSALLKRIDNSELRDAIDRAAGHVAYLMFRCSYHSSLYRPFQMPALATYRLRVR